ncbi:MFS transporter [Mangrovimicrobium sediminis]|uniref:MFS transporter n=1 Tax=Mangrovimicrobium sediminis TaxID=2562682 RepID=A0A4Z0M578_9GAMM|nr:MFS transporter [Haliea sp. SAOS-164]TGD74649.1 MFS transporter [Haliea sp. SAOS-164]
MRSFLPLIRSEWRLLLFGFMMMFCSSFGQTFFIGLFGGDIRAELGLGHGDFGAIYSGATLASAALLLWSGALIDRLDLRHYACLVAAGLSAGCLLLAASTGPLLLFFAFFALRHLGQGLMGLAGPTAMVRYLPEQRGKANALSGMGFSFAEALLPTLAIALLAGLGWRQSWVFWGVLLLLTAPALSLLLLRGHRDRHRDYLQTLQAGDDAQAGPRQKQWTRAEVLRDARFYLFLPALLAQPVLFTGFIFHQVPLVEAKQWSLSAWAALFVFYALVNIACKLLAGLLVDRFGAVRLVPVVSLPLGLGLLALASSDQFAAAWVFMGLMAVSVGTYSTLSSPFYSELYGTLHLGSIKSLTSAAMVFGTAIAPILMGAMIDRGVSMDAMAVGGLGYTLLASALALAAVRRPAPPA